MTSFSSSLSYLLEKPIPKYLECCIMYYPSANWTLLACSILLIFLKNKNNNNKTKQKNKRFWESAENLK